MTFIAAAQPRKKVGDLARLGTASHRLAVGSIAIDPLEEVGRHDRRVEHEGFAIG